MKKTSQELCSESHRPIGSIIVQDGVIRVKFQRGDATTSTSYSASVENLCDAARVLARWMDISYEDIARECQRIHELDEFKAFIRDSIEQHATNSKLE